MKKRILSVILCTLFITQSFTTAAYATDSSNIKPVQEYSSIPYELTPSDDVSTSIDIFENMTEIPEPNISESIIPVDDAVEETASVDRDDKTTPDLEISSNSEATSIPENQTSDISNDLILGDEEYLESPDSYSSSDSVSKYNLDNFNFTFTTIDETIVSSKADGKPKLLYFFAYDNERHFATLSYLAQKEDFSGVDIIAISANDESDNEVLKIANNYRNGNVTYCYDRKSSYGYPQSAMFNYAWKAKPYGGMPSYPYITYPYICYIDSNNKFQYSTESRPSYSIILENLINYCGYVKPVIYKVHFVYNISIGSEIVKSASYGTKLSPNVSTPEKNGYVFAGWYKDKNFTNAWDFNNDIVTEDTFLYAKYEVADKIGADKFRISEIKNQKYTGKEITPKIIIKYNGKTLTEGTDYILSYMNNVNVGTATVAIKCIGKYEGTRSVDFKIVGTPINNVSIKGFKPSFEYNGVAQKQDAILSYKGRELTENSDYTVTYSGNTNKGTAIVTYNGIGGFTGSLKKTFVIKAFNLSKSTSSRVTASIPASQRLLVYTKGGAEPVVEVFDIINGTKTLLEKNKDYTLSYLRNNQVTTSATVIVKGKGNYSGRLPASSSPFFTITAQNISNLDVSVADILYDKKTNRYKSTPVIYDLNGKKLEAGKDYAKSHIYAYANETSVINKKNTVIRHAGDKVVTGDKIPEGTRIRITIKAKETIGSLYTGEVVTTYRIVGNSQ